MKVEIKYLNEELYKKYPITSATSQSAGIDVRNALPYEVEIDPHSTYTIPLGFAISPKGAESVVTLLLPRSSIGCRGLMLANTVGVIDNDFQGEIKAVFRNMTDKPIIIEPYERIAQLIVMPYYQVTFEKVERFSSDNTERDTNGFGSTGKF